MDKVLTEKRTLGKTGIEICTYGFGAWGIGGIHYGRVDEDEARKAILRYVEAGGNYIDTARDYGDSERLIGQILKENRLLDDIVLSTKTRSGEFREDVDGIRRDLEMSLKNLQRDYADILFLHWPPETQDVIDLSLKECEKLKAEGLIKAVGASVKGPDVMKSTQDLARVYIKDGRVDVLMMVYSIFRQMNYPVFKEAHDSNIGIIVRTVLESGFLTGAIPAGTRFPAIDHRSRWNNKIDFIAETVGKLESEAVKPPYEGINEVAIQFSAAAEGITSVIIGALNRQHLEATLTAITRPPLDHDILSILREKYQGYTDLCNSGEGTMAFVRPDGIK